MPIKIIQNGQNIWMKQLKYIMIRNGREGEAELGGDDAKALVGRLRQMLVLEGVDPDEELA